MLSIDDQINKSLENKNLAENDHISHNNKPEEKLCSEVSGVNTAVINNYAADNSNKKEVVSLLIILST